MTAKNGTELLSESGIRTLVKVLFPLAAVVTPNVPEASRLCGKQIKTIEDMAEAARSVVQRGPQAVIIKGGHLRGEPIDIFYDGIEFAQWKKKGSTGKYTVRVFFFRAHCLVPRARLLLKRGFFWLGRDDGSRVEESYRIDKKGYFYMSTGIMNHLKLTRKMETTKL
jgi:hydroxymethylpyrimidine/phosphomethylpyrimidine kinase